MRWWLVLLGACGRINFGPLDVTGDGAPRGGDGSMTGGDGSPSDAMSDGGVVDTLAPACAQAMPVTVNVQINNLSTCATGLDRIDGCAGPALQELVFKFVVPTSGSYTVRTYDTGTANVITTGNVDQACSGTAGCFGISGSSLTSGQTLYYVVEANTGTCQNIDFSITMP